MNINNAAMNAINSMYQMIIAVDNETMSCSVLDCNEEVAHIARDDKDFSKICERLYVNIHPEDRASFLDFTDQKEYYDAELLMKIKQSNTRFPWLIFFLGHILGGDGYERFRKLVGK